MRCYGWELKRIFWKLKFFQGLHRKVRESYNLKMLVFKSSYCTGERLCK